MSDTSSELAKQRFEQLYSAGLPFFGGHQDVAFGMATFRMTFGIEAVCLRRPRSLGGS